MKSHRVSLSVKQRGLLLIALLLSIEIGLVSTLGVVLYQSEKAAAYEASAKDLISGFNELVVVLTKLDHYAYKLIGTGKSEFRDEFWRILPNAREKIKVLEKEAAKFPPCTAEVQKLMALLQDALNVEIKMVTLHEQGRYDEAAAIRSSDTRSVPVARCVNQVNHLQDLMQPIAQQKSGAASQSLSFVYACLAAGVFFNIILAVVLALFFVKGITSRLGILADNSYRLAAEQALNPPLLGTDEIARLDSMFHKMADAVQESARKERALTENACDVICSIDANGKFVKVNHAATEKWGYEREALIGHDVCALLPDTEQEQFKHSLNERISSKVAVEIESHVINKEGAKTDVLWTMQWSDSEQCIFSVIHDISERKRAEEMLKASQARTQTVLDSMLVGLITATDIGQIESSNPRADQILQSKSGELQGKNLKPFFPDLKVAADSFLADMFKQFAVDLPDGKRFAHVRELMLQRDPADAGASAEEPLPVELWLTELPGNQLDKFLINIIDVKARHELEKVKQEFVSVISKDIRTPLAAIEQFLQQIVVDVTLGKLRADGKSRVELATRNVGRLLRLIDDLREINSLETGQLDLQCQDLDLGGIVQRALDAVRAFSEQHGVKLESLPLSIAIHADSDRLERVLINLISNAIKFSPDGETVRVVVDERANDVLIQVIDRGRGVPESHRELIFERFKQVSSSDATEKGGTGLGLAICKAVVEQHGGSIGVDSEEGKGSNFWFTVPKLNPEST